MTFNLDQFGNGPDDDQRLGNGVSQMTEEQRTVFAKLIDEAERTLLALQDGPLPQGDLPGLRRAVGRAKKRLPLKINCSSCGGPLQKYDGNICYACARDAINFE